MHRTAHTALLQLSRCSAHLLRGSFHLHRDSDHLPTPAPEITRTLRKTSPCDWRCCALSYHGGLAIPPMLAACHSKLAALSAAVIHSPPFVTPPIVTPNSSSCFVMGYSSQTGLHLFFVSSFFCDLMGMTTHKLFVASFFPPPPWDLVRTARVLLSSRQLNRLYHCYTPYGGPVFADPPVFTALLFTFIKYCPSPTVEQAVEPTLKKNSSNNNNTNTQTTHKHHPVFGTPFHPRTLPSP